MLDRLLEYVLPLPEERLSRISLQDMALCWAWHDSYAEDPLQQQLWAAIPAIVSTWSSCAGKPTIVTEGRRHQWILRELIDTLQSNGVMALAWDETYFLCRVHDLTNNVKDAGLFERVRSILGNHRISLDSRVRGLLLRPGLPILSDRLHVVTSEDLMRARPREIKLFAGIAKPGRGPVFTHKSGHLKILDSVPENCTVVVENGSCSVEGFVMGKLAATQHCEVQENISGVVVVRQGDIRARNIIVRAYVVSKWGNVFCMNAESPDLVFAGNEIRVETSALMGRYVADKIRVKGDIHGGLFEAASLLTAARFRRSEVRDLSIVLRRELSCTDYGEEPGPDASKYLGRAARLRRQLGNERTAIDYANQEAEHAASCALVYLNSVENMHPIAERLHKAEHRLALVNRIVSAMQTLAVMAEDRLNQVVRHSGSIPDIPDITTAEEPFSQLDAIHAELAGIKDEGQLDRDVNDEFVELSALKERLLNATADQRRIAALLMQIREKIAKWRRERDELTQTIGYYEKELQNASNGENSGRATRSNVHLLRRLLATVRERGMGSDEAIAKKLQSVPMRMALRTVNNSLSRASTHETNVAALQRDLADVAQLLRKDFQIIISEGIDRSQGAPRVSGCFDARVRIYADPFLLNEPQPPAGSCVLTPESGESPRTYCRQDGFIVEMK
ncbi:MAG: hypothetical protein K1Y02_03440 [Candidatus Hydrogenedentes bacterium]|nr:hypothetical protein [Candidatus Hydrogenedentota bacterium]